jgi:hypothetical protein
MDGVVYVLVYSTLLYSMEEVLEWRYYRVTRGGFFFFEEVSTTGNSDLYVYDVETLLYLQLGN